MGEAIRDVIRTCIGCRRKFSQKVLIRFVCLRDGKLEVDGRKKLGGRGAYVCRSQNCVQIAFKSPKRINALLRVQLASAVIAEFEQVLLQWVRQSAKTTEE